MRKCSICSMQDKSKLEIDKSLVRGASIQDLSRQYDISEQILRRHKEKCLSRQLIVAAQSRDLLHSQGLLDILEGLLVTSNLICAEAYAKGKLQISLNGVNSARNVVETVSKIVFGIKEMELEKEKIDKPTRISVTLVDGEDLGNLDKHELETYRQLLRKIQGKTTKALPEPKKETRYVRRKGRPRNTPDPVPILEDQIDHDMEPEIEDEPEPEIERTIMPGSEGINWDREKRKARRRQGLIDPKAKRKRSSDDGLSDALRAGRVRVSRNV